jgi:acyl-CoA synthetase (AMP-forming)/AMP-acid ligase II
MRAMPTAETIIELLANGRDNTTAIAAVDRPSLTYAGLRRQVAATIAALNRFGIGRDDPVAIVLPNGPEMATAFVGVAAGATAAPLNPAYRTDEFDFYLTDLGAKALIVQSDAETPARAVAERPGIGILELGVPGGAPAGAFELRAAGAAGAPVASGPATADDVALVLHTSGTTSRPKIVPLTQRNLCASAASIGRAIALSPADRCLNVMPLFHIHGLMAAVLATLAAGASVICTPGFNALRFFGWLDELQPSWYTAVPTMHQAILARAARNPEIVERARLRLIRSSSASLPPQVMADLERLFRCPVIESYGMTEAAHQMASNPLPPAARKPGTVGTAAGPEVAIMGTGGQLLPAGAIGEVVIRGPGVTRGYQNNQAANASAFTDGWFHTGDQGRLDGEGYLTITGRLKEIINRGGEKVAPLEVDNVLTAHPAVAQALTFAMPHTRLGEEVAAAIVLKEGHNASESEIRAFAAERLADFKVPRKLVFLAEIPKGATGKLQRIGLAERLGLSA